MLTNHLQKKTCQTRAQSDNIYTKMWATETLAKFQANHIKKPKAPPIPSPFIIHASNRTINHLGGTTFSEFKFAKRGNHVVLLL